MEENGGRNRGYWCTSCFDLRATMTSWTEGLIDWSVGVAVGRGTIVVTISFALDERVYKIEGRSSFCWCISVDQTSLSKQQHAAYLERRKPERQSFNHRASLKLSAYGRSQSINQSTKHLHPTRREWLLGRGSMLLLAEGWCIGAMLHNWLSFEGNV